MAHIGSRVSRETRAKLSAAQTGQEVWPDVRRRMSASHARVVTSPEIRAERRCRAKELYRGGDMSMAAIAAELGWSGCTISKDLNRSPEED